MSSFVESGEFERILERITADDASLPAVDLNNNRIGAVGVRRLADALCGNTHVTELDLDYNNAGVVGAMALAEMLGINSTLTMLRLEGNGILSEGARALAEALLTNSAINELDLANDGIDDDIAMALADMLRTNSAIAKFFLDGNNISDEGGRALANVLLHNSTIKEINLRENNISNDGARAFYEALHSNHSITELDLRENDIKEELVAKIDELVDINGNGPDPEEAHRLKIELRIGWMLDSEGRSEFEAAVTLALAELGNFPEADRRRGIFERLLGSAEIGVDVAASADEAGGRALYRYAAECGAAPVVLMNLLRAHPSLCACRDVKQKLYPFMLLATMRDAGVGNVLEALLENPSLVKSGIDGPDEHLASKPARFDGSGK